MADGRHLRNRKIAISQERFDEDLHDNVTVPRLGNLWGRLGSCPPNYNIGWAANVFCPPKKFSQHISSRPNKQTKRYRPTVVPV